MICAETQILDILDFRRPRLLTSAQANNKHIRITHTDVYSTTHISRHTHTHKHIHIGPYTAYNKSSNNNSNNVNKSMWKAIKKHQFSQEIKLQDINTRLNIASSKESLL